jgi:aromatic-amino-acid transaminase
MFQHVEPFAGDPILSLNEDFQKDPRPGKINLSIGIYFDDAGRIPVLDSVRRAEQQVWRRVGAEAVSADRGRRELPQRRADAAVRHRPRGHPIRSAS